MNEENDPIREFQSKVQRLNQLAEELRPIVRSCEDAILRAESKATIDIQQITPVSLKVRIMLVCKHLKEPLPLLRELAKEGIHTDKIHTHEDYKVLDVLPMREYNLGKFVVLDVVLLSPTDEEGQRCRVEQVGVKEVPVYEMKCD